MRRTVLIVDDSRPLRLALRTIINQQVGWYVCGEASNGAEGVAAAVRLRPGVVVLDFCMPVMNGVEAAAQIKKLVPEAHLLMFTSFATPSVEEAAHLAGIDVLVDKDDCAKLLQALEQFELDKRVA